MKTEKYINWESAVSAEEVFSDVVKLGELCYDSDVLYWLEMRPSEGGRYVIVRKDSGGISDVTPFGFNVRNRVHEYGGGSFTVFNSKVYFVNFDDQRIYVQEGDSDPVALTPAKKDYLVKYASLCVSADGARLYFVQEIEKKRSENSIGCIDLRDNKLTTVAFGCDFYADVTCAANGKIAFMQWNDPHMPWDSTELVLADSDGSNAKIVAGGEGISVCHPRFDSDSKLYFCMDYARSAGVKNYWNIYCHDGSIEAITSEEAEFGEPHWVFGQSPYVVLDDKIIAVKISNGSEELVEIDLTSKKIKKLSSDYSHFGYLCQIGQGIAYVGASSTKVSTVVVREGSEQIVKKSSSLSMDPENISTPKQICYPTTDGAESYAYFYEPKNKNYSVAADDMPPLLVLAHGGPTGATSSVFSFVLQFWTSAGYAVVDVDYRGSTGYGRAYRDALLGKWGIVDIDDVANAVKYLSSKGLIDSQRVAVRGGSAGGYVVQRVLTEHPDLFSVGASYCGIGNLITITEETHKFEAEYMNNLVGTTLAKNRSEFEDRSPINHLDKLKAPMILIQGADDKIVTPENSREMARILKEKGIEHEYVEYEGEAHGLRSKKNNVDALTREFNFYRKVFQK